jgi:TonB family protein
MRPKSKRRDFLSFLISAFIHAGIVLALVMIPIRKKQSFKTVDLDVETKKPLPAPEPEAETEQSAEPEQSPEAEAQKPKKLYKQETEPPPLAPPPDKEVVKEDAPEAPPVFDLGDNTFALGEGQGGSWSLAPSEGNTKFAPVAKRDTPSVRGTKAKGSESGKPGGRGEEYRPVPIKDLSRRPEPKSGAIAVPAYPAEARREGVEGSVVLQVFIDRKGKVKKARIIKDPGGGLGDVARTAMLKEEWTPPLDKSGNPVDTVIIYSYRFVLEG